MGSLLTLGIFLGLALGACEQTGSPMESASLCDPDDGGLDLADGFCATVVADNLGPTRHLTVADNGDVYAALRQETQGGGLVALRDTDGDYTADQTEYFGAEGGTGIGLREGYLYFGTDDAVWRYQREDDELVPSGEREVVATDFPEQRSHEAKSLSFDGAGTCT